LAAENPEEVPEEEVPEEEDLEESEESEEEVWARAGCPAAVMKNYLAANQPTRLKWQCK
jgi:hypothetical protein